MSIRARFHLSLEFVDQKTSTPKIKSTQLDGRDEIYEFPINKQSPKDHADLCKLSIIKAGLSSLRKHGQFRNLVITIREELKKNIH